jgi:hypothetical protein
MREREEKEIPQGLFRAALALFSPCGIHRRFTWQGITHLAQETVHAPHWEIGETVPRDMWLCQCLDEHCIALVRATHLCLQGSWIPRSQMSNRRPQWECSITIQCQIFVVACLCHATLIPLFQWIDESFWNYDTSPMFIYQYDCASMFMQQFKSNLPLQPSWMYWSWMYWSVLDLYHGAHDNYV